MKKFTLVALTGLLFIVLFPVILAAHWGARTVESGNDFEYSVSLVIAIINALTIWVLIFIAFMK